MRTIAVFSRACRAQWRDESSRAIVGRAVGPLIAVTLVCEPWKAGLRATPPTSAS